MLNQVNYNIFDLYTSAVVGALALVLLFVTMPDNEQWRPFRRMNKLLVICYGVMCVADLSTALLNAHDTGGNEMRVTVLIVSMYQAMLFTAACITFISPRTVSVRWLSANTAIITAISAALAYMLHSDNSVKAIGLWTGVAAYVIFLVYYCRLFRRCYREALRRLEISYDEDMSGSLSFSAKCFLGALTVGVAALIYVIFDLGPVSYQAFKCIYIVYYTYLAICFINYRIKAGYIVKVIAAPEKAPGDEDPDASAPDAESADADEERSLAEAIDSWVEARQYVRCDLTVEEIAQQLGTTHVMFKWYFANRIGTPFRTWRQELRLEEAKRILREEDVSVSAVHKMVGIADKSNFHKIFRKQTGMTPLEYKNHHGNDR